MKNAIPMNEVYAINFRFLRRLNRLSQRDVAALVGINPTTVSQWENMKYNPSLVNMEAAAQVLGVGADVLLNEDLARIFLRIEEQKKKERERSEES